MFRRRAISDLLTPARCSFSMSAACTAAVAGRPNRFPFACACAKPALVRSCKTSRSKAANTASMAAIARPAGVVRSSASVMEAYVALHTNRYSVPVNWTGRRVEVRETRDKIEIQLDARNLVTHARIAEAAHQRVLLAQHRPPRGQGLARTQTHPEEKAVLEAVPEIAGYVAAVKQRSRKVPGVALRQLLRLVREYPREPLLSAVREAARYGLYDLDRLERMILRRVAREYFLLDDGNPRDD